MAANPTNPPMGTAPLAPQKAPKFRHSFWWYLKWTFYTLALLVFCVFVAVLSIGYGIYNELEKVVPDTRVMTMRNKADSTRIYAADGKTLLAVIKGEDRIWKPFDTLVKDKNVWPTLKTPEDKMYNVRNILKATLSIEDARFYIHPGMDTKRLAGALVANLKSGNMGQGGSTITEQLAVNLYQSRNKSVARRLQAALLALQIERRFSKDEILELYVNEIYYGSRAYGCEAAARTFLNKSSSTLSIGEAALIAGLPQRPTYYDPFDHFDRAKKRQRIVLGEMLQNNYITRDQYRAAVADTSVQRTVERAELLRRREKRSPDRWVAPYFVAYVKAYLAKQWDISEDTLKKGGLKIVTTLQPQLQHDAENTLIAQLKRLSRRGDLQGALVSIDPWTGHVVAMVGGRDYYDEAHRGQFNRATQARRQPGSTMKPYIYATAMEMGYSPNSIVIDSPLYVNGEHEVRSKTRDAHEIKNYDFIHRGALPFQKAMGISDNVAATRVLLKVGIPAVIQKAHLMGIQSPLRPYPTLALGTSELTLLEHVSAYGVFATRGLRAEPCPVERVENSMGEVLVDHPHPVRGARVMSAEAGNKMWDMLRYVVTSGTGKAAAIPNAMAIGKTGTTSSNKDVWFMGATKQLVTGVWLGYDKPRELRGSSGGRWCAPVWRNYMVQAVDFWDKRNVVEKLVEDSRLTEARRLGAKQDMKLIRVRLCNETGLVATTACPSTHVEIYSAASGVPEQVCYVHVPQARPVRSLGDGSTSRPQRGDLGFDPNQPDSGQKPTDSRPIEERADDGRWLDQPAADKGDVIIHSDGTESHGISGNEGTPLRSEGDNATPRREHSKPVPEATAPPAGGDGY